ncbi:MAG: type II toxin-antitoxin system RelE/ParE family toxin [Bacteroidota bacterium]|jgi:phage-related protein
MVKFVSWWGNYYLWTLKKKFRVEFLQEAMHFLETLDQKAAAKVIYNITKAQSVNDAELFKKLTDDIWEFRTLHRETCYRLFAFWDKRRKDDTVVIATHGMIKKTMKVPQNETERALRWMRVYFEKNKLNEK